MHNGFMDLLYLYDKFYEPLPRNYLRASTF